MDLGPNSPFWAVFFWSNVAVCIVLAVIGIRFVRQCETKRKQLKKDIKTPGFGDIRWLFKHKLKEHGIDKNEKTNSSNR